MPADDCVRNQQLGGCSGGPRCDDSGASASLSGFRCAAYVQKQNEGGGCGQVRISARVAEAFSWDVLGGYYTTIPGRSWSSKQQNAMGSEGGGTHLPKFGTAYRMMQ